MWTQKTAAQKTAHPATQFPPSNSDDQSVSAASVRGPQGAAAVGGWDSRRAWPPGSSGLTAAAAAAWAHGSEQSGLETVCEAT